MSLKAEWKKIETRWKAWWAEVKRSLLAEGVAARGDGGGAAGDEPVAAAELPSPSLASCWEGTNAQTRHMNELSHKFTDEQVAARLDWAVQRGCNTVHWFLVNKGDGEGAGYSIYGGAPTLGRIDEGAVARMEARCKMALRKGLSVALWLLADDSGDWVATLLGNPGQFAEDVAKSGLLKYASCVVLGLEMDEAKEGSWSGLAKAVRGVWGGKVGVHHRPGHSEYAGLGDIFFLQTQEKPSASEVASAVQKARKSTGKPVVMFELARNPQRGLCEAALAAGAVGVGNW